MYIGGLDIGTTGCKLTVFNEQGEQLHKSYCDYPIKRTASAHDIDATAVLKGVWKVIQDTTDQYVEIEGIGITSFGETFVMTDGEGNPLHPAMLYTDPRGSEQCKKLCERIGEKKIAEISGTKPHEMYSLPKIMWIKENQPEIYKKAEHVFLMEDFVIYHLTGKARIDYSLATRTMGFDIKNFEWSKEIFEKAGIDLQLMSQTVPTGTIAGTISNAAAKKTGLREDTKIVCISHDQIAAAVGAGVFDSDTAVDGAGTVECITPIYDEIPDMEVMTKGNYAVVPYAIPGKYVCYAFSYTGGALIQWCTDTLAKKEKEQAGALGITVNEYLESQSCSPTGILVLPHFAGAATPYMDTESKGAVLGLTTATTAADIYRGCMEGVVYEMVLNLEYLKQSGTHFKKLHATGGGAHSQVWMQMKADMINLPIISLNTVDAGTVGSAMLTGIAIGCFADLEEAALKMVRPIHTYHPRAEMHEKYSLIYQNYRGVYKAVRSLL